MFVIKKSFMYLAVCFFSFSLFALEVPQWIGPVRDDAGVISAQAKKDLETYLTNVNNQTGVQVAVLTIPSLDGDSLEDFSIRTATEWKLGHAGKDNGALLVVAVDDRALRIETGYGLEHLLTDAKCGLIIRNIITPYFRDGDYETGIVEGITNMVGIATENAALISSDLEASEDDGSGWVALIIMSAFFVFYISTIIFAVARGRRGGYVHIPYGTGYSRSSSSYSGRSSFGGGGFSGGGGGFSGGGGRFGGGGASGSW